MVRQMRCILHRSSRADETDLKINIRSSIRGKHPAPWSWTSRPLDEVRIKHGVSFAAGDLSWCVVPIAPLLFRAPYGVHILCTVDVLGLGPDLTGQFVGIRNLHLHPCSEDRWMDRLLRVDRSSLI